MDIKQARQIRIEFEEADRAAVEATELYADNGMTQEEHSTILDRYHRAKKAYEKSLVIRNRSNLKT